VDLFLASDWGVKWGLHFYTPNRHLIKKGLEKNARYSHLDAVFRFSGSSVHGLTFASGIKYARPELGPSNQGTQSLDEFNVGVDFVTRTGRPILFTRERQKPVCQWQIPWWSASPESVRACTLRVSVSVMTMKSFQGHLDQALGCLSCSVDDKDAHLRIRYFQKFIVATRSLRFL